MARSQSVLVLEPHLLQKSFLGGGGGGDTVKITSAPGPDHLILNWNRLKGLKIDLEWTRNGPGLDLDLDLSLTITNYK